MSHLWSTRVFRFAAVVMLAMAGGGGSSAWAGQHLVAPGDDWAMLVPKIRPGDEVILMPGRHRGASIELLTGTPDKPITIRGGDPENPAEIDAGKDGIRLKQAANLIFKDLSVSGGTVSGITISGPPALAEGETPTPQRIQFRNVTIKRIGPKKLRHGLSLTGLEDVRIQQCRFEGWGGSAIEIVSCRDVVIEECRFLGVKDFAQENAIRVRAGSDRVRIEKCRFENAGTRVVCLGGPSLMIDFTAALPERMPKDTKLFEVQRANVEGCTFIGGQVPVVFSNAEDCVARNNTIIRPTYCVFAILAEQVDPRFGTGTRCIWGYNLSVWDPGDIQRMVEFGPGVNRELFFLEENLWWSAETPEQRAKLGKLPGKGNPPQLMTVDPKLDDNLKPTAQPARGFGAS